MLGSGDAEAEQYRCAAEGLHIIDDLTQPLHCRLILRAGDAVARNGVNVAAGVSGHALEDLAGGLGRGDEDRVDAGALGGGGEGVRLAHGDVGKQYAIGAGLLELGVEAVEAASVGDVGVDQHADRQVRVALADGAHLVEGLLHGRSPTQSADMSALDGGAVGDWVGERHAELECVGACFDDGGDELHRVVRVRVGQHDEGDERALPLGKELLVARHLLVLLLLEGCSHVCDVLVAAAG